jgi:ligand-binding SRPBCC domain-containing protein
MIGPLHWLAVHTAYAKDRFFEDTQIEGPFAEWVHRHEFAEEGRSTRLTDRLDFELPGGVVVDWLLGWAVKLALIPLFRHRHRITKQYCEKAR